MNSPSFEVWWWIFKTTVCFCFPLVLLKVVCDWLVEDPKPPDDLEMDDEPVPPPPATVEPEPGPTPGPEDGIRFEPAPVDGPPAEPHEKIRSEVRLFPGCKHVPGKRPPRPKRLHMAVDVPPDITRFLREQGWTVTTANDAHLGDESEEANLEYAASRRSVLVSRSIDYEIVAHATSEHNGVLIVPDGMTGELLMDICRRLVRRKGVES